MFRNITLYPLSEFNLSHPVPPTIRYQSLEFRKRNRIIVNVSESEYSLSRIHRMIILAVCRNLKVRYSSVT